MAEWELVRKQIIIRCGTTIEQEQKKALGYGGRTMETLKCSGCHMLTMVDDSVRYDYCPHCGAKMKQYWEPVYPTWAEYLETFELYSKSVSDSVMIDKLEITHIPADIAEKLGIAPKEG